MVGFAFCNIKSSHMGFLFSFLCYHDIGIDGVQNQYFSFSSPSIFSLLFSFFWLKPSFFLLTTHIHTRNFQGGLSMWIQKCLFSRVFGGKRGALCYAKFFSEFWEMGLVLVFTSNTALEVFFLKAGVIPSLSLHMRNLIISH